MYFFCFKNIIILWQYSTIFLPSFLLVSAASTTIQLFPLLSKLPSQWMMKLGMDKE